MYAELELRINSEITGHALAAIDSLKDHFNLSNEEAVNVIKRVAIDKAYDGDYHSITERLNNEIDSIRESAIRDGHPETDVDEAIYKAIKNIPKTNSITL